MAFQSRTCASAPTVREEIRDLQRSHTSRIASARPSSPLQNGASRSNGVSNSTHESRKCSIPVEELFLEALHPLEPPTCSDCRNAMRATFARKEHWGTRLTVRAKNVPAYSCDCNNDVFTTVDADIEFLSKAIILMVRTRDYRSAALLRAELESARKQQSRIILASVA